MNADDPTRFSIEPHLRPARRGGGPDVRDGYFIHDALTHATYRAERLVDARDRIVLIRVTETDAQHAHLIEWVTFGDHERRTVPNIEVWGRHADGHRVKIGLVNRERADEIIPVYLAALGLDLRRGT